MATEFEVLVEQEKIHAKVVERLKLENNRLREEVKQMVAGYNPDELVTLFGKSISEWLDIYNEYEVLKKKYADVLKLAKKNADCNEYCLQDLEKENERLKERQEELEEYNLKLENKNDKLTEALLDIRATVNEVLEDD